MTAVLPAVDALRRDSIMPSLDDNQIKYVDLTPATIPPPHPSISYSSSTDWKAKYYEVADMLAETRAELDEFHTSSKELEEELIKEIERTEKAQRDLTVKVSRIETERDEWKVCHRSSPTTRPEPLCPSPSSCPFRPPTTQQQQHCSANWIRSGRSPRNSRSNSVNLKWATTTLNETSAQLPLLWPTSKPSIPAYLKRKFFSNTSSSTKLA